MRLLDDLVRLEQPILVGAGGQQDRGAAPRTLVDERMRRKVHDRDGLARARAPCGLARGRADEDVALPGR
jgi:hypothetical protein